MLHAKEFLMTSVHRANNFHSHLHSTAFKKTTLANGIRIVSEEISSAKSVSVGVWVDSGSRNETEKNNGISHFIEHMVFKGTDSRSIQQIARSVESVGGYMNAFTSKEHTCFYARVLDEYAENAIDVLSDLLQHPTFPKKEIAKEKMVVLEELKNAEDDPDDQIHDFFEKAIFGNNALGFPVIGTAENVTNFTQENLFAYLEKYYSNGNIVVAAAGNISHDILVALVEKYFTIKRKSKIVRNAEKIVQTTQQRLEYKRPIQQAHVCTGTLAFSLHSAHRYPSLVLNTLLGDGMSSRLFQNIREKHGIAYSVFSFMNLLSDTGSFGVYIGTDAKHINHSLDLVGKELRALQIKSLNKSELQRTKAQLKGNMLLGLESTSNRMMRLGSSELYFGELTPIDEIVQNIDAVNADQVTEVAKQLFNQEKFSTIIFVPEKV